MKQEEKLKYINWVGKQVKLFVGEDGECYVRFAVESRKRVHRIYGVEYGDYLRLKFTEKYKKIISNQEIKEVQAHQAAIARQAGKVEKVHKRFARTDGAVYVDLCDKERRVVKIDDTGVRSGRSTKVNFIRSSGQKPLPVPKSKKDGKGFTVLRKLLHNMSTTDFKLILCWLVHAILSNGPYPILVLQGQQGSAKSSSMQLLKNIVDPYGAPIRALPKNTQDLIYMAQNHRVLAFDNISKIIRDIGDAICRMATGSGIGQRKLYTDGEEIFFEACRPVVLNGIADFVTQNDLADRVIMVTLKSIEPGNYLTMAELTETITQNMPYVLWDLYSAVHVAMVNYDGVEEIPNSRMADFERVSCAVAPTIKWSPEAFKKAYSGNISRLSTVCFESDQVAMVVFDFISDDMNGPRWEGSASELRKELLIFKRELENDKYFPKAPNKLSTRIKEALPTLKEKGVSVDFRPTRNKRFIIIEYTPDDELRDPEE